jgi:lysophospholipid acyltransferase (LPLAT)-like uncharacterized protein
VGQGLVRALFTTVRFRRHGWEPIARLRASGQPVIFVFWHGQLLPLVHAHRGEGIVVLVSEHADGEIITRIIHRYGFGSARGSSTRGATRGLRELLRAARSGRDLALTPDGPRGPARIIKPGALMVAKITGLPVVPLAVGARRASYLGSWDRFMIPHPATRVDIAYGAPIHVPPDCSEARLQQFGSDVEAELERLSRAVGDPRARPAAGEGAATRLRGAGPGRGS